MNIFSALILIGVGVFLVIEIVGFIRDIKARKNAKKELEFENDEKSKTDNTR